MRPVTWNPGHKTQKMTDEECGVGRVGIGRFAKGRCRWRCFVNVFLHIHPFLFIVMNFPRLFFSDVSSDCLDAQQSTSIYHFPFATHCQLPRSSLQTQTQSKRLLVR